jgi:alpha-amylase/alpha-mannosidase (GH57 family)
MRIRKLDLAFLLKLKAHPELVDKLSLSQFKRIWNYCYLVEGGDWDQLTKEEETEDLKMYLASEEFIDSMPYFNGTYIAKSIRLNQKLFFNG